MEFKHYSGERKGENIPKAEIAESSQMRQSDGTNSSPVLVTNRLRAFVAIAFTLWTFTQGLRSLASMRPYSPNWLYSELLPKWAVVPINIAFYCLLAWVAVRIAFGSLRKDEKALISTLFAVPALIPLGVLIPKATSFLRFVQTLLELTGLLASISILLSFQQKRKETPPGERRV